MAKVKSTGKDMLPEVTEDLEWGQTPSDHMGYRSDEERLEKRGLEDWEMVEHMESSRQTIPYWFVAVFIVLLLVAVGLTFPFWGNRPGFERNWFDWGIPAGMAWVVIMSGIIYYFVDGRYALQKRRESKKNKTGS